MERLSWQAVLQSSPEGEAGDFEEITAPEWGRGKLQDNILPEWEDLLGLKPD